MCARPPSSVRPEPLTAARAAGAAAGPTRPPEDRCTDHAAARRPHPVRTRHVRFFRLFAIFFGGNLAYSTHTSCRRPEPYIRHQMDPRVHTFVSVSAGLVRISPSRACYHRLTLVRDRPSTALHNRTGGERRQQADHSGAKHRHSHPPPAPRRVPDSALVTVAAGGATTTSLFEFAALGANVRGHRGVGDTCKRGRGKRVRWGLEDKST